MSVSIPQPTVEQAQRRLREVLDELRAASETALSSAEYYCLWLTKLVEAMGADAGRAWLLTPDGSWQFVHAVGAGEPAGTEPPTYATELEELRRVGRPLLLSGKTRTVIVYPIRAGGTLRGAVRWELAVETEAARQGCLKFIDDAALSIERHHWLSDVRAATSQSVDLREECRLAAQLQKCSGTAATAFALANEGRLLLGCDRLSVLVRRGGKYRVVAVSGQDGVNRRTAAVRSMEQTVARCATAGETLTFPAAERNGDDDLTAALEAYVDANDVKRLVVAPLSDAEPSSAAAAGSPLLQPLGALLVEYFGENPPRPDEAACMATTARCGAAALRAARDYDAVPGLAFWQMLGRRKQAWLEPGTRRRRWLTAAAVAAGLLALVVVPADYTAFCRGTLNPVERRRIFAPLDGVVARIHAAHGVRVVRGQTLVELRNTDLDLAEAEVAGRRTSTAEQLTSVERILLDESKRLTAEERARLSGERSRHREQLASLDRQLELYADKRRQLTVVSPIDGEVITWSTDELLENRPVRQGQQLLTVAAVGGDWQLELNLPENRSGRVVEAARTVPDGLRVTFNPAVDPGWVREGRVVEIENSAELRNEEGNTVLVRVAIRADELPQRRPGAEAAAHIHCGRRAVGYVWLSDAYAFLRSQVLFRWF